MQRMVGRSPRAGPGCGTCAQSDNQSVSQSIGRRTPRRAMETTSLRLAGGICHHSISQRDSQTVRLAGKRRSTGQGCTYGVFDAAVRPTRQGQHQQHPLAYGCKVKRANCNQPNVTWHSMDEAWWKVGRQLSTLECVNAANTRRGAKPPTRQHLNCMESCTGAWLPVTSQGPLMQVAS